VANTFKEDDVEVSIHLIKIEAIREGDSPFKALQYPIDMKVGEAIKRPDNSAIIHFSIKVATNPKIVAFLVEGDAVISGIAEHFDILTVPEASSPPPIWKAIYKETMGVVSTLSSLFNIPAPPSI